MSVMHIQCTTARSIEAYVLTFRKVPPAQIPAIKMWLTESGRWKQQENDTVRTVAHLLLLVLLFHFIKSFSQEYYCEWSADAFSVILHFLLGSSNSVSAIISFHKLIMEQKQNKRQLMSVQQIVNTC